MREPRARFILFWVYDELIVYGYIYSTLWYLVYSFKMHKMQDASCHTKSMMTMTSSSRIAKSYHVALCLLPLLPSLWVLLHVISANFASYSYSHSDMNTSVLTSTGAQLLLFTVLGVLGYLVTNHLIPSLKCYMIRRGICGKDLGKKGNQNEDVIM